VTGKERMGLSGARRLGLAGMLGATAAVLVGAPALGAVVEPNTFSDENGGGTGCSLREAILATNTDTAFGGCPAGGGADTIPLVAGTYVLSIPPNTTGDEKLDGDLDVEGQLTITHAGVTPAAIDGGGVHRVIHVLGSGGLTASGFTIRNGRTDASGGGIRNEGNLDLSSATVTGNETTGSFGGGIANAGLPFAATMLLTNVTVSGNRADGDGGGIDQGNAGGLDLNNVTVTGNTTGFSGGTGGGGGIFNGGGTINLKNTIIAGNHDNTSAPLFKSPDCGGEAGAALTSGGSNLIGDPTDCNFVTSGGDKISVNPLLGPLADNGGSTLTHALLTGSPAINGAGPGAAATDQRGVPRSSDIGAYELVSCGKVVVNRVGTAGADSLTGTAGADGFLSLAGADTASGLGGADALCGGDNKDKLKGGAGKDLLRGEGGKDKLKGGGGKDKLVGGPGKDTLIGGKGKDVCKGGGGKDVLKNC
jgi:CSLREA domain-containing protein